MVDEAVILFADSMAPEVHALVLEACAQAKLTPHECGADGATTAQRPLYAIAAIPAGERAVPASIARRLDERFPAVPLVMLCAEPLVRPTVSLQHGRITLIGAPLTSAKLSAQLSARPAVGGDTEVMPPVRARENRGPGWWSACLWRRALPAPGARQELRPFVGRREGAGFVGLFPTTAGAIFGEGLLEAFAQAEDADAERTFASVVQRLDGQAAVVWLHPRRRIWSLAMPANGPDLRLLSPTRLPQRWRLRGEGGRAASGTVIRTLPAVGDDVIVAVSTATGPARRPGRDELADLPLTGGPTVLDRLEERLQRDPACEAALIVEARP